MSGLRLSIKSSLRMLCRSNTSMSLMKSAKENHRECGRREAAFFFRLMVSVLALLATACGVASRGNKQTVAADGSFPRTLQMADGAEIVIPQKPVRIISLTPSNDEILCALVDEKRITGLSKYSQDDATSHVADIARRINVFIDRDAEQIISLRPDLILAARYTKLDLRSLISQTGVPIFIATDFRNFDQIEANVRLIGRAVGEEERADAVVAGMRQKLAAARARLRPDRAGLRVLYLAPGNFTAGAGTSIHEILVAAGLKNAVADAGVNGNVKIAAEQMSRMDPDLILIGSGYERDRGFRSQLESDQQLSTLDAIKHKRIIEVPSRSVLTVSHRVADAVDMLVESVNQIPMSGEGEKR
jgi:iron complex transport system substrate-binding protein